MSCHGHLQPTIQLHQRKPESLIENVMGWTGILLSGEDDFIVFVEGNFLIGTFQHSRLFRKAKVKRELSSLPSRPKTSQTGLTFRNFISPFETITLCTESYAELTGRTTSVVVCISKFL